MSSLRCERSTLHENGSNIGRNHCRGKTSQSSPFRFFLEWVTALAHATKIPSAAIVGVIAVVDNISFCVNSVGNNLRTCGEKRFAFTDVALKSVNTFSNIDRNIHYTFTLNKNIMCNERAWIAFVVSFLKISIWIRCVMATHRCRSRQSGRVYGEFINHKCGNLFNQLHISPSPLFCSLSLPLALFLS